MSREFYVPCTSYAYQQCGSGSSGGGGSTEGVVVSVGAGNGVGNSGSGVGGMDCMPLRPGPFHYLISEQAKSLVALQELQNEVGALLEFRDLVIETFPNLRHKMAATASAGASVMSSTCTQSSHIPLPLSSPSSRRIGEWEPGKIRRRATREAGGGGGGSGSGSGGGGESSSSSLPRSRSNSHSGGTKNNCSATVQDSGFSTETSSKDSASTAIAPRASSPRPSALDEAEDELWNLLDVIHRKGIRLREEVECLQGRLESVTTEELASTDVLEAVRKVAGLGDADITIGHGNIVDSVELQQQDSRDPQVIALRREKEQLLDKVAELEAETISSRARAQELQTELAALSALKTGLEDRLRAGLTESGLEILAPGAQRLQPIAPVVCSPKNTNISNIKSKSSAFASVAGSPGSKAHKSRFRTRTIERNVILDVVGRNDEPRNIDIDIEASVNERRARLGALDSILVSPTRVANVKDVDSRKIAAILREHSPLELQRHLITTTVHNQVLQKRLDEVEKSTETLSERLDKAREENDDLRFQLEERNIELEGTRARVRVLERLQQRPPTEIEPEDLEQPRCEQSGLEPGSSTESARDHHQPVEIKPSPRRRPSRIPLPGNSASGKTASTTPTAGATATTPSRLPGHGRNDSRESLKSLTRPPRDSSRDSHGGGKSLSKTRDSNRDSLGNRSLSKNGGNGGSNGSGGGGGVSGGGAKETNRESSLNNRSLPRNNSSRDSLNKSSSLSRARDSLESNNNVSSPATGTTNAPPRRPPAPTRRSHSLARAATSVDASENGKSFTEPPSSWCSTNSSFRHSDSSLYPDSLNQETSSVTGSTRVEFIIGSPTRRFRTNTAWPPHRYFDSIDSAATVPESLLTDEFPLRRGEALAECDSLECHPISSED
ncbi:serine-rich adhesin for platelets [Linepithema humile]|uniref:serine-rich adhesin for platelets n=1 Tax=Linepithema humile TaxID=83485 RepID=UPI00351E6B81